MPTDEQQQQQHSGPSSMENNVNGIVLRNNLVPPPVGTMGKRLPLVRLTREGDKHFYGKNVIDVDIMEVLRDQQQQEQQQKQQ